MHTYVSRDVINLPSFTLTLPSGPIYVGECKDNDRHGTGTNTSSDGRIHVGEWKDDKMHGTGTLLWRLVMATWR